MKDASNAEKAKRARSILEFADRAALDCVDQARAVFCARLIYIRVTTEGADIEIGDRAKWEEGESLQPIARYSTPKEVAAEWDAIKQAIWSRDSARDRARGRRSSRVGA